MPKRKRLVGRPPKYDTAEDMQVAIEDYFENGVNVKKVLVGKGENQTVQEIPVPTITGLILHIGYCDRNSFYDLESNPKFSSTVKKARAFIENHYEELLQVGNTTGAIFALKNFGWFDRQQQEITGKDGKDLEFVPEKFLAALIAKEKADAENGE